MGPYAYLIIGAIILILIIVLVVAAKKGKKPEKAKISLNPDGTGQGCTPGNTRQIKRSCKTAARAKCKSQGLFGRGKCRRRETTKCFEINSKQC